MFFFFPYGWWRQQTTLQQQHVIALEDINQKPVEVLSKICVHTYIWHINPLHEYIYLFLLYPHSVLVSYIFFLTFDNHRLKLVIQKKSGSVCEKYEKLFSKKCKQTKFHNIFFFSISTLRICFLSIYWIQYGEEKKFPWMLPWGRVENRQVVCTWGMKSTNEEKNNFRKRFASVSNVCYSGIPKSLSPYSSSRYHVTPPMPEKTHEKSPILYNLHNISTLKSNIDGSMRIE